MQLASGNDIAAKTFLDAQKQSQPFEFEFSEVKSIRFMGFIDLIIFAGDECASGSLRIQKSVRADDGGRSPPKVSTCFDLNRILTPSHEDKATSRLASHSIDRCTSRNVNFGRAP